MAEYIRSNILDARTMATEVLVKDLPINPISHIIVTIEALNATDEATIAEILGFINRITVTHKGIAIYNLTSEALAAANLYHFGSGGLAIAPVATDNQHLGYSIIIPFGRKLYDPTECFHATRRGEFQISLDTTIPATSLDGALISISAVELPDASPTHYLKSVQQSVSAPGSTGDHDIEIPIGNQLLALIVGMASFAGASEFLFGIDDFRLLANNQELNIVSAKAPELLGEMINRVRGTVRSDAAQGGLVPNTHLWLDFDPTGDGMYAVETDGLSDLKLRGFYGVDEATTVTPIELVSI